MYATSTQKQYWTFNDVTQLNEQRKRTIEAFVASFAPYIESESEMAVMPTPDDEYAMRHRVQQLGISFSRRLTPTVPAAVPWIALTYFKRFFLSRSTFEYTPRNVMTTCFFFACKIHEFYMSITDFVKNLQSDTPENSINKIRQLEPDLMSALNYQLTVHTPFTAFEGHLIDMKTKMPEMTLDFEAVRTPAMEFFDSCLLGDAPLLYAPTHIALAAIDYGLQKTQKSNALVKEFFYKLLDIEPDTPAEKERAQVEKLQQKLGDIISFVEAQAADFDPAKFEEAKRKSNAFYELQQVIDERKRAAGTFVVETNDSDSD